MAKKTKKKKNEEWMPTEAEKELLQEYHDRKKDRVAIPSLKVDASDKNKVGLAPDHPDETVFAATIERAFGTRSWNFAHLMLNGAINAASAHKQDLENPDLVAINGVIAAIDRIGPKDEIESMLVSQMVLTHQASVEALKRAALEGQTFEGRKMNLSYATKLSRTYTAQMEALNRHRGKGQQKMTVEHVHVHEGGQAIVGNVQGGGVKQKKEEQPHAKQITHAPGETLRSEDPERESVPVASNAER